MTDRGSVVEYIEAQRGRFTREAIDGALREAGHAQWSIDAAWAAVDARARPDGSALRRPGMGTILLVLGVIAGYGVAAWLVIAFTLPSASWLRFEGAHGAILITYAAAMVIRGVVSVLLLLRAPSTGGGERAIGVAFAISIVVFVGLSGACFAGLSASAA